MTSRERLLAVGSRRGERLMREVASAAREARIGRGLTLREVSGTLGISRSKLSRWEQGSSPRPDIVEASRLCQVLGLDLALRTYPAAGGLRDAAHLRLIARFRAATPRIRWRLESVMPIPGDQRAWDLLARIGDAVVAVAAETRLRDVQALLRREHAKMRDSGADRLILLVWGTHANRGTLREIRESLRDQLPMDTRSVLDALRARRDPGASGIVLL